MLKLLFWGLIGYVVYRYFQMKGQLKDGKRQDSHRQENFQPGTDASSKKTEGDFIDYEEVK
ncbi:MAG: hypothetical protein HY842_01390 [Bacteroidetes bacterium]|nr:hypothetical protein [Bacteroidota bacterium]